MNWNERTLAGKHSQKPDKFYRLVENVSPEPRLDIFARSSRLNWDTLGDELPLCLNDFIKISANKTIRENVMLND